MKLTDLVMSLTTEMEDESARYVGDVKLFCASNEIKMEKLGIGDGDWPLYNFVGTREALERLIDRLLVDNPDDAAALKGEIK